MREEKQALCRVCFDSVWGGLSGASALFGGFVNGFHSFTPIVYGGTGNGGAVRIGEGIKQAQRVQRGFVYQSPMGLAYTGATA